MWCAYLIGPTMGSDGQMDLIRSRKHGIIKTMHHPSDDVLFRLVIYGAQTQAAKGPGIPSQLDKHPPTLSYSLNRWQS